MSLIHNVTIIGGRKANPALLRTRLEPMKLEDNMCIAAKLIAFGEVANISGDECKFTIQETITLNSVMNTKKMLITLEIPEGRYVTREDVLLEIKDVINNYVEGRTNNIRTPLTTPVSTCKVDRSSFGQLSITPPRNIEILVNDIENVCECKDPLWSVIKAHKSDRKVWLFTGALEERTGMAFVYMNIVENSYINGKKSRVLTPFPIQSKGGYSYHEFTNSTYVPVEVKEFTEIEIELRDIQGKLLKIDNSYDTIISLHISSINTQ
jgi:hypothetical protein